MSAANEQAVSLFLNGKLGFNAIYDIVADAVSRLAAGGPATLEALQSADVAARRFVLENCRSY